MIWIWAIPIAWLLIGGFIYVLAPDYQKVGGFDSLMWVLLWPLSVNYLERRPTGNEMRVFLAIPSGLAAIYVFVAALVTPGYQWWMWLTSPLAAMQVYLLWRINGSNRRTEEDHPDPQTGGTASAMLAVAGAGQGAGANALASRVAGLTDIIERPALETVQEDMPILACRYASLVWTPDGPAFHAVNSSHGTFSRDAEATCHKYRQMQDYFQHLESTGRYPRGFELGDLERAKHSAPHPSCDCGFYAVPADKLPAFKFDGHPLVLQVELSGRVIEHESGYRAEHQRVIAVQAPPCPGCAQPAARLWMRPTQSAAEPNHPVVWDCGNHDLLPRQDDHSRMVMAVTLDQLSARMGVEFGERTNA